MMIMFTTMLTIMMLTIMMMMQKKFIPTFVKSVANQGHTLESTLARRPLYWPAGEDPVNGSIAKVEGDVNLGATTALYPGGAVIEIKFHRPIRQAQVKLSRLRSKTNASCIAIETSIGNNVV